MGLLHGPLFHAVMLVAWSAAAGVSAYAVGAGKAPPAFLVVPAAFGGLHVVHLLVYSALTRRVRPVLRSE